ncbi:SDR family NAD(P)-dependent oxidoreductase [Paenibacillus pabuli]|uniref:SDR family NAD(P)-dependent oxidoreductase n=1 Tax=Paenibacillus pabuli TaxID=1472 RepID=UPI000781C052|nr:SDR family NAD(P)-dependent oxidoreductase [Paenibacillus pabuli]MEC0129067.1 SDR family NAD(P)-dependent oxidoreductase [Paenibacillus pabuli]
MMLKDQTIFITGASRGIGRQVAMLLAEAGADVVINGRNIEALEKLREEIEQQSGRTVLVLPYSVDEVAQVRDAFQQIKRTFGKLDALVNNAGVLQDRVLGMIDEQTVHQTLQTNLASVIYHTQYASRMMSVRKQGSIVNISSIIGTNGNEGQVLYAASKAGIIGVTKSASKELAPQNIRVNAVAPGFIDTDMARSLPEEKFNERLSSIKMKRIGAPKDVANVILFLCSDLSNYVTGQVIGVDGGMLI